eukprot:1574469-Pyramimonas_sp.AAC.2
MRDLCAAARARENTPAGGRAVPAGRAPAAAAGGGGGRAAAAGPEPEEGLDARAGAAARGHLHQVRAEWQVGQIISAPPAPGCWMPTSTAIRAGAALALEDAAPAAAAAGGGGSGAAEPRASARAAARPCGARAAARRPPCDCVE